MKLWLFRSDIVVLGLVGAVCRSFRVVNLRLVNIVGIGCGLACLDTISRGPSLLANSSLVRLALTSFERAVLCAAGFGLVIARLFILNKRLS